MMAERGLLVDPTRLSGAGVKSTRLSHDLQDPKDLAQCDRQLFARLKALDSNELLKKTKDYLTKLEAEAVMARRDKIVAYFEKHCTLRAAVRGYSGGSPFSSGC
jgi:hypothetical protein